MKKEIIFILIIGSINLSAQNSGKVGIGTTDPKTTLHVNGTSKTKGLILDNDFTKLGAEESYSYLIKSPSPENKITTYNESFIPNNPAPINVIQFKITTDSSDKDWINEYDTKINSNKFSVIISSFSFQQEVVSNIPGGVNYATPVPQIYAYQSNGTWKFKADYQGFAPQPSSTTPGVWTLNLIVFDKAYTRNFAITQSMKQLSTGSSATPLINY